MIKITVSYEHTEELNSFLTQLRKDIKRIRTPREQKGRYRKAYIELKNTGL